MFTLNIQNHKHEVIQLSQNERYTVTNITGLNPPTASVNGAENANFDGATYKSSRMNTRNIVITLKIEGNVEKNRIALYTYIKVKHACTVFYTNGTRNVFIQGYVESLDIQLFEKKQMAQISIICMNPYFVGAIAESVGSPSVIKLFQFPFTIEETEKIPISELNLDRELTIINDGDVSAGIIVEFFANGTVENPAIYNVGTNDGIKVNITLEDGDMVRINTNKGQKGAFLISKGVQTNIINDLDMIGSAPWLQLESGSNTILFDADLNPQFLECSISYNDLYEGV